MQEVDGYGSFWVWSRESRKPKFSSAIQIKKMLVWINQHQEQEKPQTDPEYLFKLDLRMFGLQCEPSDSALAWTLVQGVAEHYW